MFSEFHFATLQPYLPHIVGCGVATLVFAIVVTRKVLSSRRRNREVDAPSGLSMAPVEQNPFGDRRSSLRREGQPVLVHLASPAFHGSTRHGWVIDRSTGGVRVLTDSQVAPGTLIQVIADNAPDTIPWVTAVVRSCKPKEKQFELGCEFETTPPWNVLLLFG